MTTTTRRRTPRTLSAALAAIVALGTAFVVGAAPATASTQSMSCSAPGSSTVTIKRTTVVAGSKRVMTGPALDCTTAAGAISLVKSTTTLTGHGLDLDLPADPPVALVSNGGGDVIAGQWRVHAAEVGGFQTLCHGGDRVAPYQFDSGTVTLKWLQNGLAKTSTVTVRAEMLPPPDGTTIALGLLPCTPLFVTVSGTVKAGVFKGSHFSATLWPEAQDPAVTSAALADFQLSDGPFDEPTATTPLLECDLNLPTAATVGPIQPGPSPAPVKVKVASPASACTDATGAGITGVTKIAGTLPAIQDNDFQSTVAGETPFAGTLAVTWNALNPTTGRPWTSTLTGEFTYVGIVPIGVFGVTGPRYVFQGHVVAGKGLYADADLTMDFLNCPLFQSYCATAGISHLSLRYPWTAS